MRCVSAVLPMQHPAQSVMDGAGGEYVVHIGGLRAPVPGRAAPAGGCTVRAVDAAEAARVAALALTRGGADTATIVTPQGTRRVLAASGGSAEPVRAADRARASPRDCAHAATRKRARDARGRNVHSTLAETSNRVLDATRVSRPASGAQASGRRTVRACARNSCDMCERRAPHDQRELSLRWHPLSLRECRDRTQRCVLLVADDVVCDACWSRPGAGDMLKLGTRTRAARAPTSDGLLKRWRVHSQDGDGSVDAEGGAARACKSARKAGAARDATRGPRPVVTAASVMRACHFHGRRHGPFFARPCATL